MLRDAQTPPRDLRPDVPRQLWPEDLPSLRLENHPRIMAAEAVEVLRRSPGSSWWIPATGEFIVVTPWRHRTELVTIHTLGAFANEDILMRATMEHARAQGKAGFVVVDVNELRRPSFYARFGLEPMEQIITYEHRRAAGAPSVPPVERLRFVPVTREHRALLDEVIALDHATFPWFWWNSEEEFDNYLDQPGVEIWAGIRDDDVVSYAGTTLYRRWGHLDRIATAQKVQGQGIGRATLSFVLRRMASQGGKRVALSTQGNNHRSRTLYEGMGFVRTPVDDYTVFMAALDPARLTPLLRDTSRPSHPGIR